MKTKAIYHFENHKQVAINKYWENIFKPRLDKAGLLNETIFSFQDYTDRDAALAGTRYPIDVASKAAEERKQLNPVPNKTVWVLDLDAEGATKTDSSYGLCVLIALAEKNGMGLEDFLESRSFLTVILTLYPEELLRDDGVARLPKPHCCNLTALDRLWPKVKKITNGCPNRLTAQETGRALELANQPGTKIIWANSGPDDKWLAELIANWLK